jgi:hypothetical protein
MHLPRFRRGLLALAVAACAAPLTARAQDTARVSPKDTTSARIDTTRGGPPAPAPAPAASPAPAPAPALPFDFSGVLFANYQTGGAKGSRAQNRFDIDRVYLTFRTTAGEHVAVRVTADIFRQANAANAGFYAGWAYRLKYAYAQWDFLRGGAADLRANARLGMLHTVIIDYEEGYWPRGIAQVALERAGYFSSADLGAATTLSFPNKLGEIYATATNGNGYTQPETDRFKDYAARLTLTPLANTDGILKTLSVTPWYYNGDTASRYTRQTGTVRPVGAARKKDRYGVLVAMKDPRFTLGAHYAERHDDVEIADTTAATAPTVTTRTGRVMSAYAIVKPFSFTKALPAWPVALLFRADEVKTDTNNSAAPYDRFYIAGVSFDLSKRASLTFDYQNQVPYHRATHAARDAADLSTYFAHLILNF